MAGIDYILNIPQNKPVASLPSLHGFDEGRKYEIFSVYDKYSPLLMDYAAFYQQCAWAYVYQHFPDHNSIRYINAPYCFLDDPYNSKEFLQGSCEATAQSQHKSQMHKEVVMNEEFRKSLAPIKSRTYCKICDRSFARPSTLKVHMRMHSGEKPFKCPHCPKAFSQSANLSAHVRVHTGEKPYACLFCGKRFSQSSSVTTHMRTHTGERPFRCEKCDNSFADRSTLSKHQRVHTRNSGSSNRT